MRIEDGIESQESDEADGQIGEVDVEGESAKSSGDSEYSYSDSQESRVAIRVAGDLEFS